MARQTQAAKDLLIFGDSNVERNILHTGRLYSLSSESVPSRNLNEFRQALAQLQPGKYRIVIFSMFTNIVINTGNSVATNTPAARLSAIEACLKSLFRIIT
jgi:hypothetical protein